MKGIALGFAVAGVAAFGFTGVASAYEAPNEVAAVTVLCHEVGYQLHECSDAVKVALNDGYMAEVNAALAAAGIDYVAGNSISH
ncbi:MAG: hypothetical protein ACKOWF_07305 [Chloroflexota bacterium]